MTSFMIPNQLAYQNCLSSKKRLRAQDIHEFQRNKKFIEDFGIQNLSISLDNENTSCWSPRNATLTKSSSPKKEYPTNYVETTTVNDNLNPVDTLFTGQKYVRKVDYLIDGLIRKTRKLHEFPNGYDSFDAHIPSNIGPQPTTDHALSRFIDPTYQQENLSANESNSIIIPYTLDEDINMQTSHSHNRNRQSNYNNTAKDSSLLFNNSNDLTHADFLLNDDENNDENNEIEYMSISSENRCLTDENQFDENYSVDDADKGIVVS